MALFDFLFREAANAIQDVRQKVVEEGWFGRVVTAAPVIEVEKLGEGGLPPEGDPVSMLVHGRA